jgi:hypothetical protein
MRVASRMYKLERCDIMLPMIIGIWAAVTVILIALSVHRSIFVMREEDTIFVSGRTWEEE